MKAILDLLPKQRQTILFSATQTKKVQDLARLSSTNSWIYVGTHDLCEKATVERLEQGYVKVEGHMKFQLLLTFLKKY